jgi:hypothetical protein
MRQVTPRKTVKMMKKSKRLPPRWLSALFFLLMLYFVGGLSPTYAFSQGLMAPAIPKDSATSDVDEVEEVVADSDVLLPSESADSEAERPGGKKRLDRIKQTQADELSYSQEEIRSRYNSGAALALGSAQPWQFYTVNFYTLLSDKWAAGLFVGAGAFRDAGTLDKHAYDFKVKSHSFGMDGRYYFRNLERLSLQASLSYVSWSGSVKPNSADDEDESVTSNLGSSFDASGVAIGFASVLTWLWDSGFYIDWTPVGIYKSAIFQKAQTRDSEYANKVIEQKIERPQFFGVANIRFGYLF